MTLSRLETRPTNFSHRARRARGYATGSRDNLSALSKSKKGGHKERSARELEIERLELGFWRLGAGGGRRERCMRARTYAHAHARAGAQEHCVRRVCSACCMCNVQV
eukprot:scaffold20513_cov130-Isochrysis_galbana.AAC.3